VAIDSEMVTSAGKLPYDRAIVQLLEEVLRSPGELDEILQARILGSLARAILFTGALEQAAVYAQRAVEVARRVGDPGGLAFNLEIFLHQPWRPEDSEKQLAYATEMLQLAEEANHEELVCDAHQFRMMISLELGDVQTANDAMAAHAQVTERLREPFYFYIVVAHRVRQALLEGRFVEAEQLAMHALTLGQRIQVESLDGIFGLHMFTLRRD
jgi:hypothetical protein